MQSSAPIQFDAVKVGDFCYSAHSYDGLVVVKTANAIGLVCYAITANRYYFHAVSVFQWGWLQYTKSTTPTGFDMHEVLMVITRMAKLVEGHYVGDRYGTPGDIVHETAIAAYASTALFTEEEKLSIMLEQI